MYSTHTEFFIVSLRPRSTWGLSSKQVPFFESKPCYICATGASEAPFQARYAIWGDDERRCAGIYPRWHQDKEWPGIFSPLPRVQHLPQPAAHWAFGQLRSLSLHAAVRSAGETRAEGRVRKHSHNSLMFAISSNSKIWHRSLVLSSVMTENGKALFIYWYWSD